MAQQVEIVGAPVKVRQVWHDVNPYYSGNPVPATFGTPQAQYGLGPGVVSQAVWESPLFDLRDDLRSQNAYAGNTFPVGRDVRLEGIGYYLFGQLTGFTSANQVAAFGILTAYALERVAVTQPDRAAYVGTRVDVTSDFFGANATSGSQLLRWRPVGNVRYWGVALIVELTAAVAFTPPLTLSWALH